MLNINDYEIQCIEQEILTMYQSCCYNAQEYERLLLLRRYIINHRVLEHQEEILPDIIAFNDALTDALKKMSDIVCPAVDDDGLYKGFEQLGLI